MDRVPPPKTILVFPMGTVRSLYARLGGHPTLEVVHKLFYDKVYEHPWLGLFFEGIDQKFIEDQQTAFMAAVMGGPKRFVGQYPKPAHKHMFVSQELFDLRNDILGDAIREADVPEDVATEWLTLDRNFENAIIKQSVDQCEQRYVFEPIVDIADPRQGRRLAG